MKLNSDEVHIVVKITEFVKATGQFGKFLFIPDEMYEEAARVAKERDAILGIGGLRAADILFENRATLVSFWMASKMVEQHRKLSSGLAETLGGTFHRISS